jgi:hypothetical protein
MEKDVMKNRIRLRAGLAALAAGASLFATAGTAQADTDHHVKVEVCAEGNYTAYAKWDERATPIGAPALTISLNHVPAGTCGSAFVLVPGLGASVNVYLFGLYNISGKGFDVETSGGPAIHTSSTINTIVLHAQGTTTSPRYWYEEWGPSGFHGVGSGI